MMKRAMRKFRRDARGQDLLEYALAAGMVAVTAVAAMPTLTASIGGLFGQIKVIIMNAVQ